MNNKKIENRLASEKFKCKSGVLNREFSMEKCKKRTCHFPRKILKVLSILWECFKSTPSVIKDLPDVKTSELNQKPLPKISFRSWIISLAHTKLFWP